jgi:D-sedoheptulose 7-phosphate isomerase
VINRHLTSLAVALDAIDAQAPRLQSWGSKAAAALAAGGRLLTVAASGSETQARHLATTLAQGDQDRPALAVSALETSPPDEGGEGRSLTDQVRELGRPGDLLICVSASTPDADLISAASAAREIGLVTWALTGPGPNELAGACSDVVTVPTAIASTAEEVHLAAIHIFCAAVESGTRDAVRAAHAAAVSPPSRTAAGVPLTA